MLSSNSEGWSTFAFCPETAQTQTQQSWEPLIVPSLAQRAPSSVTLRFAQGKPAVHHLRAARTP